MASTMAVPVALTPLTLVPSMAAARRYWPSIPALRRPWIGHGVDDGGSIHSITQHNNQTAGGRGLDAAVMPLSRRRVCVAWQRSHTSGVAFQRVGDRALLQHQDQSPPQREAIHKDDGKCTSNLRMEAFTTVDGRYCDRLPSNT